MYSELEDALIGLVDSDVDKHVRAAILRRRMDQLRPVTNTMQNVVLLASWQGTRCSTAFAASITMSEIELLLLRQRKATRWLTEADRREIAAEMLPEHQSWTDAIDMSKLGTGNAFYLFYRNYYCPVITAEGRTVFPLEFQMTMNSLGHLFAAHHHEQVARSSSHDQRLFAVTADHKHAENLHRRLADAHAGKHLLEHAPHAPAHAKYMYVVAPEPAQGSAKTSRKRQAPTEANSLPPLPPRVLPAPPPPPVLLPPPVLPPPVLQPLPRLLTLFEHHLLSSTPGMLRLCAIRELANRSECTVPADIDVVTVRHTAILFSWHGRECPVVFLDSLQLTSLELALVSTCHAYRELTQKERHSIQPHYHSTNFSRVLRGFFLHKLTAGAFAWFYEALYRPGLEGSGRRLTSMTHSSLDALEKVLAQSPPPATLGAAHAPVVGRDELRP